MDIRKRLTTKHYEEIAFAAKYAPFIQFDRHEPFLPEMVGYTIFREDGPSSSFERDICLKTDEYQASTAIEYAIWWDWDIEHLYELEHAWIYVDTGGNVVYAEASWHGVYHNLLVDGKLPLNSQHVILYSEPGKHAFAPDPEWFNTRRDETLHACQYPGRGGLWITPLFEKVIVGKNKNVDMMVQRYLETHSFEPSHDFAKEFVIDTSLLVPWSLLFEWIPYRISWWISRLRNGSAS